MTYRDAETLTNNIKPTNKKYTLRPLRLVTDRDNHSSMSELTAMLYWLMVFSVFGLLVACATVFPFASLVTVGKMSISATVLFVIWLVAFHRLEITEEQC